MSRGYQRLNVDGTLVKELLRSARSLEEYKRYQAVDLRVNEGMDTSAVSRITGLSESMIHNLHSRCRKHGLESLRAKKRGGRRRSYLSEAEERGLLAEMDEEARRGGILEVSKFHKRLEEKVGGKVALFTSYRMLHRHGWRKIAPRPRHPKADKEAQTAFKKTGRNLSKKPQKKPKL